MSLWHLFLMSMEDNMKRTIEDDVKSIEEFIASNTILEVARTGKGCIKYNYDSKKFLVIPKEPDRAMEVFERDKSAEALLYLYNL